MVTGEENCFVVLSPRSVKPESPLSAVTRFLKTPPVEEVATKPWAGDFWKVRFLAAVRRRHGAFLS